MLVRVLGVRGTGERRRSRHARDTVEVTTAAMPAVRRRRRWVPYVLLGAGYLVFSLALQHRALGSFGSALIGHSTADADVFGWWLNWVPFALGQQENPLFSKYMHYPLGVNAMWNASVPLIGFVFAPLTLTLGPTVTFNTAMVLGPVASGLALVLALRPFVRGDDGAGGGVRGWTARGIAGALYAFNPFHLAHALAGHLNLVWSVLPPILILVAHHLFRGQRPLAHPWRTGALVGLLLVGQLLLYTQTLALGAVCFLVTAVVLLLRYGSSVRPVLPGLARAAAACLGVFAVLGAYPMWLVLAGPARPRGTIRDPAQTVADLLNVVVPTEVSAIRPAPPGLADEMVAGVAEQGGYVGVAMLALVVVAVVSVRSTVLRTAAVVGAVTWVFSLGSELTVLDDGTGVPLPWAVFDGLPLLSQVETVRFQLVVALCVCVVVALWIDRMPDVAPSGAARVGAVALTAFALLSWIPADAQQVQRAPVPELFAAPGTAFAPDDVLEFYPRVTAAWDDGAQGLRWQVASGMAFRTPGGYFIASDSDDDVVIESEWNRYQIGAEWVADGKNQPSDRYTAGAAGDLRALGVTVVAVVPQDPAADPAVLEWTRRVTGDPGRPDRGVWVFRPAPG